MKTVALGTTLAHLRAQLVDIRDRLAISDEAENEAIVRGVSIRQAEGNVQLSRGRFVTKKELNKRFARLGHGAADQKR